MRLFLARASTLFLLLTLPAAAQTVYRPVLNPKLTGAADVSGLSNKSTVRSDLGTNDAANLTTGTVPIARIPTGTSSSTVALGNDSRIVAGSTAVQSISLAVPSALFTSPVSFTVTTGAATGTLAQAPAAANTAFGNFTGSAAAPAFATAATVRSSLVLASSGTNGDITSLTSCNGIAGSSLVISSTGTGQLQGFSITSASGNLWKLYNTVDQTTNTELATISWVSNVLTLATSKTGTGTLVRNIRIASPVSIGASSGTAISQLRHGVATLSGGTVTVSDATVTTNTRIFPSAQSLGTVSTPKALAVTARSAGVSFTITSADATDTSTVAYTMIEP